MMRSLWTGATGMVAQQLNIDVISNNLANVNTTGFKKSRAEFEDLMYQTMRMAGSITEGDNRLPVGIQVGLGTRPTAVHKFFTQGDFQNTGNALDVAIEGDGFFQVDVNGELMYTRAGSFKLNQDGTVVTANGYILQPEFAVPAETKTVSISSSGHIAALDAQGQELAGAEIPLYTFINPAGLDAQPLYPHRGFRRRRGRRARHGQRGHPGSGLSGNVQRGSGGRNGQHDRGPARL